MSHIESIYLYFCIRLVYISFYEIIFSHHINFMLDCEDFLIDLFLPNYTCIISILLDVFFKLWCSSARTRLLYIAVSMVDTNANSL